AGVIVMERPSLASAVRRSSRRLTCSVARRSQRQNSRSTRRTSSTLRRNFSSLCFHASWYALNGRCAEATGAPRLRSAPVMNRYPPEVSYESPFRLISSFTPATTTAFGQRTNESGAGGDGGSGGFPDPAALAATRAHLKKTRPWIAFGQLSANCRRRL